MVDQNLIVSFGTNKPLESNVLEHQNASETMQPTTFQMVPNEQITTTSMMHQQPLEERNEQQHPWFHLGWNRVPKVQQHQHLRNRMNPQRKNYHSKNLMHQNVLNQSSSQDQQNQNFGPSKQETYNDWQPNNDLRLQNTNFNINDKNNYNNSHSIMNQNTFNSSPIDAFPNLYNESYQGIGEFIKERSQNGIDGGFNPFNMNPLFYPQIVDYCINNDTNALQPGLVSNSIENSPNSMYNFHCIPQEQQSNFQNVPQEQGLRHNLGFQRNSNPTYINNCSPRQQGLTSNLEIERDCHSISNPQRHFKKKKNCSSIVQEIPNVEFKPQCLNLQDESSSNITSQGIGNLEENNFQHDVLRSQGAIPNLNCTLKPLGVNTAFNPHNALPTLNITFSPTFHNSPSILPTIPKPQSAQCIDKKNVLNPSQITITPNEACNIPITKFSSLDLNSYLDLKNSSRQRHYMCSDARPSTPNGNPTRDVTPNHCSPHQHQGHSSFDQVQVSHDFLESCAIPAKCNYKKNVSRPRTRESYECNSDNDYDESFTPNTKKKFMNLASKKLKSRENCCEENNCLDNIPMWIQTTIVLPAQRHGCHNITHLLMQHLESDLSFFKCGLAHFFLQDTSASLIINEIRDLKVMQDLEKYFNISIQEEETSSCSYLHKDEQCLDDMPSHIKSTMLGCSLTIPITDGFLNIGKWQVICICEQLKYGTCHRIVVTLNGT